MVTQTDVTARVVDFALSLELDTVPPEVITRARHALADYIAVAVAAQREAALARLVATALSQGGDGDSPVIGHRTRLTPFWAAVCNGASAHHLELDDGHTGGHVHPGVSTLPALLTLAEQLADDDLLAAMIAGYEVGIRLGEAVSPEAQYQRSMHIPALVGTMTSVVALSRALRLSPQSALDAFGAAVLGPVAPFIAFSSGSSVKDLYGGWPAAMGLLCIDLGRHGLGGPRDLLEGDLGFLSVAAGYATDDPRLERLTAGFGVRWAITEAYTKPYAACSLAHTSIDAALALRQDLAGRPVERVTVATHVFADRLDDRSPGTSQGAKSSIPWAVACALTRGQVFVEEFHRSALEDPALRGVAARVEVVESAEATRAHLADDRRRPSTVTVRAVGGKEFSATSEHARGTRHQPLSHEELRSRFDALVGPVLEDGGGQIWDTIMGSGGAQAHSLARVVNLVAG